jgi:hypothetical protein
MKASQAPSQRSKVAAPIQKSPKQNSQKASSSVLRPPSPLPDPPLSVETVNPSFGNVAAVIARRSADTPLVQSATTNMASSQKKVTYDESATPLDLEAVSNNLEDVRNDESQENGNENNYFDEGIEEDGKENVEDEEDEELPDDWKGVNADCILALCRSLKDNIGENRKPFFATFKEWSKLTKVQRNKAYKWFQNLTHAVQSNFYRRMILTKLAISLLSRR